MVRCVAASVWLVCLAGAAYAGPLDPPGPPSSTYKTLVEVEPRIAVNDENTPGDADSRFKITESGSYYLLDNVVGADRLVGIEIAASGVTLDLMGYELIGLVLPPGMSQSGVRVTQAGALNVVIRNGSTRGWGSHGIDALQAGSIVIEDLVASQNIGDGVRVGDDAVLRRVQATQNGGAGASTGAGAQLRSVHAANNDGVGLSVGDDSAIHSCVANDNAQGVIAGAGCKIIEVVASANTGDGINAGDAALIKNCQTHASVDGSGIEAGKNARVIDCQASENANDGVAVQAWSFVSGCTTNSNGDNGIESTLGGTTVLNCHAAANALPGIGVVDGENRVERCTVTFPGAGATIGIAASQDGNVVTGNFVEGFSVGVQASGAGTLVVKNTLPNCTTPVDVSGGAVAGASSPSPVGAGPWDNITP